MIIRVKILIFHGTVNSKSPIWLKIISFPSHLNWHFLINGVGQKDTYLEWVLTKFKGLSSTRTVVFIVTWVYLLKLVTLFGIYKSYQAKSW